MVGCWRGSVPGRSCFSPKKSTAASDWDWSLAVRYPLVGSLALVQSFNDDWLDIVSTSSLDFKGPLNPDHQHTLDRVTFTSLCCGRSDYYYVQIPEPLTYCEMVEKLVKSLRLAERRKRHRSKNCVAKYPLIVKKVARYSFLSNLPTDPSIMSLSHAFEQTLAQAAQECRPLGLRYSRSIHCLSQW